MAERLRALVGTSAATAMPAGPDAAAGLRGVHLVAIDADGCVELQGVVPCDEPTFVVRHPRLPIAYAVNELPGTTGRLSVLSIPQEGAGTTGLGRIADVPLAGQLPCHLALAADACGLFVAHFGCATVQWLGLDGRGLPDGRSHVVQQVGRGVHPRRQASAHAHCVLPLGNDVYVTDLGLDAVFHYRLVQAGAGTAAGGDAPQALELRSRCALPPGAGPRHLCASRDGARVHVCNELGNSISSLRRSAGGELLVVDGPGPMDAASVSTLPAGFTARSATGEIALHPGGRWLYVSNRGHDSIAWFDVVTDGLPAARGWTASGGAHPRHFAIAPDGRHMVVANRDTSTLQLFALDPASGALRAIGAPCREVAGPMCVCFL